MRAKIKYAVFVKEDILEAVQWYNKAQKGLGTKFLKHLKEKIEYIAKEPETAQIRYQEIQIAVIKTFPYTIHYEYIKNEKLIYIFGVFHTSINPNKWLDR